MSANELDGLEAALKERRKVLRRAATQLPRLEERRAALLAELKEVETRIAVFTGEAPPKRPAPKPPQSRRRKKAR